MVSMNLDELRVVKREMVEMRREAQQVMHPLEVAGVLISRYRLAISYLICRRGETTPLIPLTYFPHRGSLQLINSARFKRSLQSLSDSL